MTHTDDRIKDRPVLSVEEVDAMIEKATSLPSEYFQLRAKCLVSLLHKFGKRRIELSRLQPTDLRISGSDLEVTFHLAKKHKRGLFQYLNYLKKQIEKGLADPSALTKPLPEIQAEWKMWQATTEGHRIKNATSLQSISLEDKYTPYVLDYLKYLSEHYPTAKFLFCSGLSIFGVNYILDPDKNVCGRTLLRVIKELDPDAWVHLFRYSKGCAVAREYGRTIDAIHNVKDTLDLEEEATAWIYVRRSVPLPMTKET